MTICSFENVRCGAITEHHSGSSLRTAALPSFIHRAKISHHRAACRRTWQSRIPRYFLTTRAGAFSVQRQFVNLARPAAEVLMVLDRKGANLSATLLCLHGNRTPPISGVLKFDGKVVSRKTTAVPVSLGTVTDNEVHVVVAELEFRAGRCARRWCSAARTPR